MILLDLKKLGYIAKVASLIVLKYYLIFGYDLIFLFCSAILAKCFYSFDLELLKSSVKLEESDAPIVI